MRFVAVFSCLAALGLMPAERAGAQPPETLRKEQLVQDMAYLVQTIEAVHPNPYHSVSKERFYALRDSLEKAFPDSATVTESWKSFAFLVASLNEGHSDVRLPKELNEGLDKGLVPLFPVLVEAFTQDGLLVRASLSPDSLLQRGDVIVSLNDVPAAVLTDRLCSTVGGLRNWRELQVKRDFAVQLYLNGIVPPYKLVYRRNGAEATATATGLTKEKFVASVAALRKSAAVQSNAPYAFSSLPGNVGYLDFRTMGTPLEPFENFLKETFTALKEAGTKALIVDLRKNGGGNSMLGYRLLEYITDEPFRMTAGTQWKVSEAYKELRLAALKPDEKAKDDGLKKYLAAENGEVLTTANKARNAGKNELRFHGKVCLLIGPNTFSSANMTANTVQDYNLATLIGEPSGEPANDYGELYTGTLPHTKLAFTTSTKMFIRANGNASDPSPVLPHFTVRQNPASNDDDVLAFALGWLTKNR